MAGNEQMSHDHRAALIRELNDSFRQTLAGGKLFLTAGVMEVTEGEVVDLLQQIGRFDGFDEDNDPHHEHDFGSLTWCGQTMFWKIDYYDGAMVYGSEDPADPRVTTRVLTVMLASEY